MIIKIHYTIEDFEDNYILSGHNIDEIQVANGSEMIKRDLDPEDNNMWSEMIEE